MNKPKDITLQILYDVCFFEDEPKMNDNIYFDLGLDSLDVQQFIIKVENMFCIRLTREQELVLHSRKAAVSDLVRIVSDSIKKSDHNEKNDSK